MAVDYNVKVGGLDSSGRLVTSVNTDSSGKIIGYSSTNAPKAAASTPSQTVTPSASVGGAGSSGSSGSGAVLSNANKVVASQPAVNDYSATANKTSAEYNNPNNWTGGAVGSGAYTYPTWLADMVANDKAYAAGDPNAYWSVGGEAEKAFQGLSSADQQSAAAALGNPGTYFDTATGTVKGPDSAIARTAAEVVTAAEAAQVAEIAARVNIPMPDLNSITVEDFSDLIQRIYAAQEQAQLAKLKATVDGQVAGYEQQIGALPGEYDPLRNQAEVSRFNSERMLNENLVNAGLSNSGTGRSERLALDTSYNSELTNLNNAEQTAVNKLRDLINQTKAAGTQEELAIQADVGSRLSEALYNEKVRAEEARRSIYNDQVTNWQWTQDFNAARDQEQYNRSVKDAELQNAATEQQWNDATREAYAHWNDIQAYMNTLDPSSIEYKAAYILRTEKVAQQDSAAASAQQQAFENNLDLLKLSSGSSGGGSSSGTRPTLSQATSNISSGRGEWLDYAVYNENYGTNYSPSNPPSWANDLSGSVYDNTLKSFENELTALLSNGSYLPVGQLIPKVENIVYRYENMGIPPGTLDEILAKYNLN